MYRLLFSQHVCYCIPLCSLVTCRVVRDLQVAPESQEQLEPTDHRDPPVSPEMTDGTERRDTQDLEDRKETP